MFELPINISFPSTKINQNPHFFFKTNLRKLLSSSRININFYWSVITLISKPCHHFLWVIRIPERNRIRNFLNKKIISILTRMQTSWQVSAVEYRPYLQELSATWKIHYDDQKLNSCIWWVLFVISFNFMNGKFIVRFYFELIENSFKMSSYRLKLVLLYIAVIFHEESRLSTIIIQFKLLQEDIVGLHLQNLQGKTTLTGWDFIFRMCSLRYWFCLFLLVHHKR